MRFRQSSKGTLPRGCRDTWRRIALTIHRNDGARVEIDLLRPAEWVARSGLAVGGLHFTNIEELELRGFARVTAIEACPPLAAGDGAVVTGRYITRGAGKLVRVTLEDGSDLVGTAQHPIWSESRQAWTPLGELLPGEQLRGRAGPLAVLAVTSLPGVADVYNLEIHGQHVYAITAAGVLVHNATPGDNCGHFVEYELRGRRGALLKRGDEVSGVDFPIRKGKRLRSYCQILWMRGF